MSGMPLKTAISDVYPLPDNATANAGFGALWTVLNEFTEKAELDLASAATTDIGAQLSTKLRITGTTGITSFGTTYRGPILLRFAGIVTLTHNATTLILPGAANITTAAGGVMIAYPKATAGVADGWIVAFSSDYIAAQDALKLDKTGGTLSGALNEAHGADILSAATINLTTATGNLVDVTGTVAITAVTLPNGAERVVRFTGILTLTNGASLVLPSAANITTAAGDFAIFRGYAAGVVRCVAYTRADGTAVGTDGRYSLASGSGPTMVTFIASGTWTKPAGLRAIRVRLVGGGGGSDGAYSGAGGGYSEKFIQAASLGATETVTVGAGGNNLGSAGTSSSFGAHCSATGGAGGPTGEGFGSGGDINIRGGRGASPGPGPGGASMLGTGGTDEQGGAQGYGGGAGIAATRLGAPGIVIVEQYF